MSQGRFDGRAVIITGATGDLGRVVSAAFADEGARLGLVYGHDKAGAEALARELTRDGRVPAIAAANLALPLGTVETSVRDAAATLEGALGRVDALVALAG